MEKPRTSKKEQSYGLQTLFKTPKAPPKKVHYQGNKEVHHHPASKYDAKDLKKAAKEYIGMEPKKKEQAIKILKQEGQVFPVKEKKTVAKPKSKKQQSYGLQTLFKTPSKKVHYQGNKEVHHHPASKYDSKDLKKAAKEYIGMEPKKKEQAIKILKKEGQVFPVKEKKTVAKPKSKKQQSYGLQTLFKTPSKKVHYQGNKEVHHHPASKYDSKDLKKAAKEYTGMEPKKKDDAIKVLKKEGQVFPKKSVVHHTINKSKSKKEETYGIQALFKAPSKKVHYQGNKEVHHHPASKYDSKDLKKAAKEYTGMEPKKKEQAIKVLKKEGQVFPKKNVVHHTINKSKSKKEETYGIQALFKAPSKKVHYQGNKEVHHHAAEKYDAKDLKKAAKEYTGMEPKKKEQAIKILKKEGQVFPMKEKKSRSMK
jgi:hypothetical protein